MLYWQESFGAACVTRTRDPIITNDVARISFCFRSLRGVSSTLAFSMASLYTVAVRFASYDFWGCPGGALT
jgi:hypothetical protein